jgi:hypothetical protein
VADGHIARLPPQRGSFAMRLDRRAGFRLQRLKINPAIDFGATKID